MLKDSFPVEEYGIVTVLHHLQLLAVGSFQRFSIVHNVVQCFEIALLVNLMYRSF